MKNESASASDEIGAASCVAASVGYDANGYEASTFSCSAPDAGDQRLIVDALTGAATLLMCATGRPRELDAHSATTSRGSFGGCCLRIVSYRIAW